MWEKTKNDPRDDKMIIRNSIKDPTKNSRDLQRDLASAGVNVDSSIFRKRLLEAGRKAGRPPKKQLLTAAMKTKRLKWAEKYKNWRKEDWRKIVFSDESHFEGHGPKFLYVRKSTAETLTSKHVQQAPKHPKRRCFGVVSPLTALEDYF